MTSEVKNVQTSPTYSATQQATDFNRPARSPLAVHRDTLTSYNKAEQNGACDCIKHVLFETIVYLLTGVVFLLKGFFYVIDLIFVEFLLGCVCGIERPKPTPSLSMEDQIKMTIVMSYKNPKGSLNDVLLKEIVKESVKHNYPLTEDNVRYLVNAFHSEKDKEEAKQQIIQLFLAQNRLLGPQLFEPQLDPI
jgi:hypothetical protein